MRKWYFINRKEVFIEEGWLDVSPNNQVLYSMGKDDRVTNCQLEYYWNECEVTTRRDVRLER